LYRFNLRSPAVVLDERERRAVLDSLVDTLRDFCRGRVLSVGATHVHILVEEKGQINLSRFCNFAKGRSARKVIALGHSGKVWARGYHTRYIDCSNWDSDRQYVLSHSHANAIVRELVL
jgi:REP element-mobilizing transposase RayT